MRMTREVHARERIGDKLRWRFGSRKVFPVGSRTARAQACALAASKRRCLHPFFSTIGDEFGAMAFASFKMSQPQLGPYDR